MNMKHRTTFKKETFDIAKALIHVNNAKLYFDAIALDNEFRVKKIFKTYVDRLTWIETDILTRLKDTSKEFYKEAISNGDTLFYSDIAEKMLQLDEKGKQLIENLVNAILAGETIEVEEEK